MLSKDYKINVTQVFRLVFERIESITKKGENAFYPFPTMFLKDSSAESLKPEIVRYRFTKH